MLLSLFFVSAAALSSVQEAPSIKEQIQAFELLLDNEEEQSASKTTKQADAYIQRFVARYGDNLSRIADIEAAVEARMRRAYPAKREMGS